VPFSPTRKVRGVVRVRSKSSAIQGRVKGWTPVSTRSGLRETCVRKGLPGRPERGLARELRGIVIASY
jgi:hypothetical protein